MEIAYNSSVVARDVHLVYGRESRVLVGGGEADSVDEGTRQVARTRASCLRHLLSTRHQLRAHTGTPGRVKRLSNDDYDHDHEYYYCQYYDSVPKKCR